MDTDEQDKAPEPSRLPGPKTWDEFLEGVIAWLEYHWGEDRPCPHCGCITWTIESVLAVPVAERWPRHPTLKEPGYSPEIPVACMDCGYVAYIHALWIFEAPESTVQQGLPAPTDEVEAS